ncbi:hypothetical protein niasHT_034069 [Heterodera trifolii]|uniref:Uncharacterized protein n=1 Tax=Heterodera trifolii TaxID=157864 RepID=A0ABD2I4E8_9BILA
MDKQTFGGDFSANSAAEDKMSGCCSEHIVEIEWKHFDYLSALSGLYTASVERRKCNLLVLVQGNLDNLEGKMVILTVHDVGKNHLSFVDFVNSPSMAPLRHRSLFLHICVPGQEPEAPIFAGSSFPSMDQLGHAMAQVLRHFKISHCFAMGEGAGADICCRFALDFPSMVRGLVLIHCTSTTHGIVEHIKEIFAGLRLEDGEMTHSAWNYLLTHRFGNHNLDQTQKHYVDLLKSVMNQRNLSRYLYSFGHRSDFTDRLKENLANVDVLLVSGAKAPHNENMMHMFKNMANDRTGLLMAEDCVDVLSEAPDNISSAIILLGQRHGLLNDLTIPIIKKAGGTEQNRGFPPLLQGATGFGTFKQRADDLAFHA